LYTSVEHSVSDDIVHRCWARLELSLTTRVELMSNLGIKAPTYRRSVRYRHIRHTWSLYISVAVLRS